MGIDSLKRAVFFDRDGVLNAAVIRNGTPHPPASAEEVQIDPSAADGIARLHSLGFLAVVITNQPDVARGVQRRETVDEINALVQQRSNADALFTCFHDNDDHCDCRKPKPGLIFQAAAELGLDVRRSYLIGDRYGDVQAGLSAGCTTVLIDRGYAETPAETGAACTVRSLHDALNCIFSLESEARDEP
uniref:D,D-heptose 1,7-bisphosphate phosphatase n=1 Tax=mine drainage metagenome TaxID=410659 RepID=E6Q5T8_9ZZZZ